MTKIGFYKLGLNRALINTCFGGMYGDFFAAISEVPDFEATHVSDIKDINYLDIMVLPMGENQEAESCKIMNQFKGPVILYTPPANNWFKKKLLQRWMDKILFAYNTDESDYSRQKYEGIGIKYLTLPFASNPEKFRPLNVEKIYDVVFVANADSGTGRYRYLDALLKRAKEKKWKVMLLGRKWERYAFPLQLVAHGELLNLVYNSARICINISNDEQKLGQEKCLDLNNRVFDLAMAGCFQVSNAPQIIRKYFSEDEVCAEDEPEIFVDTIEHYLSDEKDREEVVEKARIRALKDHVWRLRAEKLCQTINEAMPDYKSKNKQVGGWKMLSRKVDCLQSLNILKRIINKVKTVLKKYPWG